MPTLDCLHRHIFLLHVYRSVSLARMRRYMRLAYLFHQCAKSLLSRDNRIADCTVGYPGVERPFSSLENKWVKPSSYCMLRWAEAFNRHLPSPAQARERITNYNWYYRITLILYAYIYIYIHLFLYLIIQYLFIIPMYQKVQPNSKVLCMV